jgi:predicted P-loop ATPase
MDKPSYLSDVDWAEWQRKHGSDPLTGRAAREWRAERDRKEAKPNGGADSLKQPSPLRYVDKPEDARLLKINARLTRPLKKAERVCSNVDNALILFKSEPALEGLVAHNEMLDLPILMRPVPLPGEDTTDATAFEPRPLRDPDTIAIQAWLQRRALRSLSFDTAWKAAIKHASDRAFHPVRQYLDALKWDGKERLNHWLEDYLDVEQSAYAEAVGPMFLIAMVARIYEPGCKADYMLVLEGPQAARKSMACGVLAGKWFSRTLPDITRDKEAMEHLRGVWLIEIAELHPIRRAEVTQLKNFISGETDRFRPAYGRATVLQPRQCVFVGTTNETQYLRDQTGNRRFWPVKCGDPDIEALTRDRDQLFAEAAHRFRSGEHWWPNPAFEAEVIAPEQEARREVDAWEAKITTWLEENRPGLPDRVPLDPPRMLIWEVAQYALRLEVPRLGRAEQNRIIAVLDRKGWERGVRTGYGQWWVRVNE